MERIIFEDAEKIEDAKVTISGVEYTVTSAKYTANVPLSALVLNKLQENVENGINELKQIVVASNAGAHNAIYRGKNITDLFYDGTLSQQIAAGTFDDIFIGDYVVGKNSNRKYVVADINYRLHMGDTECTTPHVLMIPERIMGTAVMNDSHTTNGGYVGSKMYTTNLTPFKTTIKNDFGSNHILKHRNLLTNAMTNNYVSAGAWYDSEIELMNENMVYGAPIFTNIMCGTNLPYNYTIDKSQLSLFRLRHDLTVALNDAGSRYWYWLRDVVSSSNFAYVNARGHANYDGAAGAYGVRPAFLIY